MTRIQLYALLGVVLFLAGCGSIDPEEHGHIQQTATHPLSTSAKEQIGVVTRYDTGYYDGGYPPAGQGACVDVVSQALRENNYDLKSKIDSDMKARPASYSSDFDSNINFRRVRNIKVFLDHHAESVDICITKECFDQGIRQAGDIVTFDQIPGGLWHIAIVSDQTEFSETIGSYIPHIIHNHGKGTLENNMLLDRPAKITGHYRLDIGEKH